MNDRRYEELEQYIKDLQADRPSGVFSRLGDDKELAIVLRTAKTVHLLSRRPSACTDFASTLERRLLVQAEETVQAERRVLRWGYILPGIAIISVMAFTSWQLFSPSKTEVASANFADPAAITVEAASTEYAMEMDGVEQTIWDQMDAYEARVDSDYAEIEITMATVDQLFQDFNYDNERIELSSIRY